MRLNSETALCKSSMNALKEDFKAVNEKIQQLTDNDGSGQPSSTQRTARAAPFLILWIRLKELG